MLTANGKEEEGFVQNGEEIGRYEKSEDKLQTCPCSSQSAWWNSIDWELGAPTPPYVVSAVCECACVYRLIYLGFSLSSRIHPKHEQHLSTGLFFQLHPPAV